MLFPEWLLFYSLRMASLLLKIRCMLSVLFSQNVKYFPRLDLLWYSEAGIWELHPSVNLVCYNQLQRIFKDCAASAYRFSFRARVERECLSFWMQLLVKLCNLHKRALIQSALLIIKAYFLSVHLKSFTPGSCWGEQPWTFFHPKLNSLVMRNNTCR